MKRVNVFLLTFFYVFAGLNHFINPDFYLSLIPEYLPFPDAINIISGIAEVVLGIGVLLNKTRKIASYLLVLMLISFIPAHIYFLEIGSCVETGLCVPEWVSWVRLLIIHPVLIVWALSVRNMNVISERVGLKEE
ncbi:MAG: hypothetical protein ED557_13900 [Balneola sp.]|nr:MAG: hypothetical protein ED557_13900 [Balneola sp.]